MRTRLLSAMVWLACGAAAHAGIVMVEMHHNQFVPEEVTIAPGDTIRWVNMDFVPHTATSHNPASPGTPDNVFRSPVMSLNQTFDHTFSSAGDFHYYCEVHGTGMSGIVHVQEMTVCTADFNDSGMVDATDIFVFLDAWFAQNGQMGANLSADFNESGGVDATDIFVFLDAWFAQNGVCIG